MCAWREEKKKHVCVCVCVCVCARAVGEEERGERKKESEGDSAGGVGTIFSNPNTFSWVPKTPKSIF